MLTGCHPQCTSMSTRATTCPDSSIGRHEECDIDQEQSSNCNMSLSHKLSSLLLFLPKSNEIKLINSRSIQWPMRGNNQKTHPFKSVLSPSNITNIAIYRSMNLTSISLNISAFSRLQWSLKNRRLDLTAANRFPGSISRTFKSNPYTSQISGKQCNRIPLWQVEE